MADQTFAVHCGFFDAINSDRTYSADEMNRPYKRVISNGVFATPNGTPSTDLQVTASSGMNIICKKGEGLFGDKWFENPSGIAITVPSNTGTVPRIDSVIVQVDTRTSGRVGNIVHRTGTPASSPVPPAINQTEGVIEYRLANIRVNAGVSAITQSMITDRRGSSDCPWVTSLIYQVDTSTLYDQWQAAYAEYFEEEKAVWDAWYAQLTEDLDVSMTLDRHVNTVTTTAQTTGYIPIGLAYNHNTDILEVYINGLRAVEGTHYVVVDDMTILVENQLQIGQEVTFVVMRSVISGSATNIMVLLQELESQIAGVAGGTPTVVDSVSDMTDTEKIYVLSTDGKWYYYSATQEDWVIGGTYGGVPTDPTLSISGSAADAKAVGDALAEKADSDDVTALDTRVTAAEDDVDDLKEDIKQSLYENKEIKGSAISLSDVPFNMDATDVVQSDPSASVYVGGNMFPLISETTKSNNGITVASDGKGKLTISGTATAQSTNIFVLQESVTIQEGMVLYFRNTSTVSGSMSFYTPEGAGINGGSVSFNSVNRIFTIPENHVLVGKTVGRIGISINSGNTVSMSIEPMLLWVSTLTEYSTYYPETAYSNVSQFPIVEGFNYIRTSNGIVTFQMLQLLDLATTDYVSGEIKQFFEQKYTFESGKYDETNSGNKKASLARIRNAELIPLDYVKSIKFPSGYDAQIHFYNESKEWVGYNPDWIASFESWQASYSERYIAFTLRKTSAPNSDISADVQFVQNNTVFVAILEKHEAVSDIYADVTENLKQARRTKNTSKDNYLTRNKPLTLFHFSDIHQEQGNLRDIINYASQNESLIDDVLCTGDIVGARFQNGMTWFDGVSGAKNILLAIGNHDVMNAATGYDDSQTATLAEIYAQFIAPYYANWNLSSDPSSGVTYYYKDYPDSKVRLIVLDCMLDSVDASADAVQYTWFTNTLADAITNSFYVVVANHCFPAGSSFIASNWTNADYQNSQTYLDSRYPEAVDTFIGNGGHFVCWLEGHSHADYYMRYVGTHGTQMALSVDAASKFNAEGYTDVNRLENDRSYNSANLVTVDTGAEVIKVVKFGAKCNYKLVPRQTLVLGFDGNIIVQN